MNPCSLAENLADVQEKDRFPPSAAVTTASMKISRKI
jgi:hypothetical protein